MTEIVRNRKRKTEKGTQTVRDTERDTEIWTQTERYTHREGHTHTENKVRERVGHAQKEREGERGKRW